MLPAVVVLFLALAFIAATGATAARAERPARMSEQIVMVPKAGTSPPVSLLTTIFRPPGKGPFPLVIINHGKAPGWPKLQGRARFLAQTAEFVRRGYVVALPMRQGYGASGGVYAGGNCNIENTGLAAADDVATAIDYMVRKPYVDRDRIVVIGQSNGGLATVAFATRDYPGVLGVVNFAGGLRNDACDDWEYSLVKTFGDYGKSARYPSLWIYGDNDSFWPWPLPQKMFNAYKAQLKGAATEARFADVGEFDGDAHRVFLTRDGLPVWLPEVGEFFRSLGLPFETDS